MAGFIAFLAILGAGFDLFIIGDGEFFAPVATSLAVAIGAGQSWWSLRHGDRAVLKSSSAVPIEDRLAQASSDEDRLRYRQFENIVEEMAIAAGLPKPKAYVIADDDPNAFATGRDPEHASIAVTDGLLRALNREELQGVVAHEMGHVRNLDIRLMTVVAALVGAILLLADWSGRGMRFGGASSRSSSKSKDGGGGLGVIFLVIWIAAIILAPFLGRLLATAVSRRREYPGRCDRSGLTRHPLALANALEKIEGAPGPTPSVKRGTAHMCIADPLGLRIDNTESGWANLWATHPPMAGAHRGTQGHGVSSLVQPAYFSNLPTRHPHPRVAVGQARPARFRRHESEERQVDQTEDHGQIEPRHATVERQRPPSPMPQKTHVDRADRGDRIERRAKLALESRREREEGHGQIEVVLVDLRGEHEAREHAPAGRRRPDRQRPPGCRSATAPRQ